MNIYYLVYRQKGNIIWQDIWQDKLVNAAERFGRTNNMPASILCFSINLMLVVNHLWLTLKDLLVAVLVELLHKGTAINLQLMSCLQRSFEQLAVHLAPCLEAFALISTSSNYTRMQNRLDCLQSKLIFADI